MEWPVRFPGVGGVSGAEKKLGVFLVAEYGLLRSSDVFSYKYMELDSFLDLSLLEYFLELAVLWFGSTTCPDPLFVWNALP